MLNILRIISRRCFRPMILSIPINSLSVSTNGLSKPPYSNQSYYNWSDPQILKSVITDEYVLDDLYKGYQQLKKRMKAQNRTLFSEDQMHFLIYTYLIFPRYKDILDDFIECLKQIESKLPQKQLGSIPDYLIMAKQLLFHSFVDSEYKQFMKSVLEKRFNYQPNINSLEALHTTIKCLACKQITVLLQIFIKFKEFVHQELQENNFHVDRHKIKYIIETFDNIWFRASDLIKGQLFLSSVPDFQSSQQSFQNLIEFLLELCTKSFITKINPHDIGGLHSRIAKCGNFTQKKTKKLLDRYSCHLVIVEKIEYVTFKQVLDKI